MEVMSKKWNVEAAQETEVIEELGVPSGSSEWASRLGAEDRVWREQLEELCDAYLRHCLSQSEDAVKNLEGEPPTLAAGAANGRTISLLCISLREQKKNSFSLDTESCAQSLLSHGYLSSTPIRPTVAFALDILALADCLQRRSPSISIQGIAKTLCDLRNVPYRRYHRVQLSSALDAYRMIYCEAERRLDNILVHNSHGRRLENRCAPCAYKLTNEPQLKYEMMVTCDGNNSLKRCSYAATADKRQYKSNYYINQSEVDSFGNEVKRGQKNHEKPTSSDGAGCEHRWKNANWDFYINMSTFICAHNMRYGEEWGTGEVWPGDDQPLALNIWPPIVDGI
ncbi:hypothetical protein RSAG8_07105, partial [Rhizoctonia solani AG-8 WAC10335]